MAANKDQTPWHGLVWRQLRVERTELQRLVVFAAASGALSLAVPIAAQALMDAVSLGALLQPIWVLSLALLVVLGLVSLTQVAQRALVESITQRLWWTTVDEAYNAMVNQHHDRQEGRHLAHRFFDVVTVDKSLTAVLVSGVGAVLQAVAGMALLAVYNPLLLALDIALVVAAIWVARGWWRRGAESAIAESNAKFALADWLSDVADEASLFSGARPRHFAEEKTRRLRRLWLQARQTHFAHVLRQQTAFLVLQVVTTTGLLFVGGWLVIQRELSVGQLVAAEVVVTLTVSQLAKIGTLFEKGYDLIAGLKKLDVLKTASSTTVEGPTCNELEAATIESKALQLGDDTTHSFVVNGDEKVAVRAAGLQAEHLVGRLTGHCTTPGELWVNHQLMRKGVRSDLLLWESSAPVLHASLRENLTLGYEVSDAQMYEAIHVTKLAGCIDLENGLDTVVSPNLFSSVRHRLAAARAWAVRPPLLVVDHALDGLPSRVRQEFTELMLQLEGTTVLCMTSHDDVSQHFARCLPLDADGCLVATEEVTS